ncbi:MAG: NADH-quinone oxidoreductase subunit M, partial [Burkholderiaceae bacterium]|nr:NADH-quinone oxidoreductase subunit M [Burkholderiaceae bacterium]
MSFQTLPWLSLSIWCPIVFGSLVLLSRKKVRLARGLALLGALLSFLVTLPLPTEFDAGAHGIQFAERGAWIARFHVDYFLGVDGLSLWFVVLTAFISCVVVVFAWRAEIPDIAAYLGAFLILSGLMTGVFSALDGLLFFVFFEATLIPMFIIIGVWGGEKRIFAAFKFFLYPFFGSLFMLVGIIYLYLQTGTFNILDWHTFPLDLPVQVALFVGFILAFGIKLPMWPVHTWLPDAHVEAPTEGSVVLAAIMLKLGAFGFVRFILPIVPDACRLLADYLIGLSLVAILYIGMVALVQKDLKKLVAYSSIVHMGFVTLGFFLFETVSVEGALVQMVSHGIISAALFLCIGILYDRTHSRDMDSYGGLIHTMPRFAVLFILFALGNCGLPGTSGFIGELLVIIGAVQSNLWIGVLTASALLLGAAYSLWMVRRVVMGPAREGLTDLV